MNRAKNVAKRGLSLLLTLAMLLSLGSFPALAAEAPATASKRDLILGEYGTALSVGEKTAAGKLIDGEFTYAAPSALNEDGLVVINKEAKTFVASPYDDAASGKTWQPVSAVLRVTGELDVVLDLSTGEIPVADGVAYSVVVTYRYTEDISGETTALAAALRAPAELANGLDAIYKIDDKVLSSLRTLTTNLDKLNEVVHDGLPIKEGSSTKIIIDDETLKSLVEELVAQTEAHGGKLALVDLVETAGVTQTGLITLGDDIADEVGNTLRIVNNVLTNDGWKDFMDAVGGVSASSATDALETANDMLGKVATNLSTIGSDWTLDAGVKALLNEKGVDLTDDALALGGGLTVPSITIDGTLKVAETTVTESVGQFTVTVKISADVVVYDPDADENNLVNTNSIDSAIVYDSDFVFVDGHSKADMIAEIEASDKEGAALTLWAANTTFLFDETKYDRTVVEDLPDTLEANAVYEIKYVPKNFTYEITGDDPEIAIEVPFGTVIVLPAPTDTTKAYDYTIGGVEYAQGETYQIIDNTVIERVAGAAYETYELDKLAADAVNTGLSDDAKAVLNNPAVSTDTVKLRIPTDNNNLVTVTFDGSAYTVTAKKYNSKLSGYWTAISAIALTADDAVLETKSFDGTTAVFNRTDVDKIEVVYQLLVSDASIGGKIDETVNLPAQLQADMAAQEAALGELTVPQVMDDLNLFQGKKDEIETAVETYEDRFGVGIYDKFKDLLKNCVADDGSLIIRNSMESFEAQGMLYYYNNRAMIDTQLARLTDDLVPIASDAGVKQLMIDKGYDQYQTRMDNIVAAITAANAGLAAAPVSDAILTGSSSLEELVNTLKNGTINEVHGLTDLELNETLNGTVPGRNTVKVTVQMQDADGNVNPANTATKTFTYPTGNAIDGRPQDFIDTTVAALVGTDAALYETAQDALPTGSITENYTVNVTISPKWFPATIVDEAGNVISTTMLAIGKQFVQLPGSTVDGIRYDYYVDGVRQSDTSYTFPKDQLTGTMTIVRKSIDVAKQEKLPTLIDKLNKGQVDEGLTTSVGGGTTPVGTFELLEKDGKQILVLRLTPSGSVKKTDVYGNIAKTVVTSGLYIGINGEDFLLDSKIYPQSAVDMVLNSGFGMQQIIDGNGDAAKMPINNDGTINEMVLDGTISPYLTFVPFEYETKGGFLMQSTLNIGTTKDSAEAVDFYVTMEDFGQQTSNLKTLKSNIKRLGNYFDVSAVDGAAKLTVKDGPAYKAYLSAAAAASYANVNDLYNMNHQAFVEFLFTFADKLIKDEDIKLSTYTNSAGQVGIEIDLERYDNYFEYLRKAAIELVDHSEADGKSVDLDGRLSTWNFTYDLTRAINKILDKAGLADDPDLANAVGNKIVSYAVAVQVPETKYVAIVVVPDASKRNIVSFPASGAELQAVLGESTRKTAVILLTDIPETIEINKNVVLDLNGKNLGGLTVTGDPDHVVVVDSTFDNRGSIGTVNGSSALKITGGTYGSDISAYLPNDYIQKSGKVMNKLYELTLEGDNIIVNIDDDRITLYGIPDAKALAVELAFDLGMNFYGAAAMTVDGNQLYDAKLTNITEWYLNVTEEDANEAIDCLNMDGINAFIAEVIDDLLDLEALYNNADGDLATYAYEYDTWTIDIHKNATRDQLDLDILSNPENTKSGNVIFRFKTGGTYDLDGYGTAREEIKDLLNTLNGVTKTKTASLVLDKPTYHNETLKLQGTGSGEVYFDLSEDPGYAIAFAVVFAANGASNKDELIEGIEQYVSSNYLTHVKLKDALEAVPNDEALAAFAELSRADGENVFADLVDSLGLTGVVSDETIKLARTYRSVLVSFGTAARKSGFTPAGALIGSYETGTYGEYSIEKSRTVSRSRDIRRWTVEATAIGETSKMTIRLFRDDVIVEVYDENDVLQKQYFYGDSEALSKAFKNDVGSNNDYTIRIYDDVELTADDVTIPENVNVNVEGIDYVDFKDNKISLNKGSTLTTDKQIDSYEDHFTAVPEHAVVAERKDDATGNYIYYLKIVIVEVFDDEGNLVAQYFEGDDEALNKAFGDVDDDYTIKVYAAVELTEDQEIPAGNNVNVEGVENVTFSATISLNSGSTLTADKQIAAYATVFTAIPEHTVVAEKTESGKYVYYLKAVIVEVFDDEGNLVAQYFEGDDEALNKAFGDVDDDYTIKVYAAVELTEDQEIPADSNVNIEGIENVTFSATISLNSGSTLTADKQIAAYATVFTAIPEHTVVAEKTESGKYVYYLKAVIVEVFDDEGNLVAQYFEGDDEALNKAFGETDNDYTIKVYAAVELTEDQEIPADSNVNIEGVENVTFSATISLNSGSTLTADKQIAAYATVFQAIPAHAVVDEKTESGKYVYYLKNVIVEVFDDEGNLVAQYFEGDDEALNKAFGETDNDYTIKVYAAVELTEDQEIPADNNLNIEGVENVTFSATIALNKGSTVTTDKQIDDYLNVFTHPEFSSVAEKQDPATGEYIYYLEPIDPVVVSATADVTGMIVGAKVDNDEKLIYLDILDPDSITDITKVGNGIDKDAFLAAVSFTCENYTDPYDVEVEVHAQTGLIFTGAAVTVTATNTFSDVTAVAVYHVIILGDTTCDGYVTSGDSALIDMHFTAPATKLEGYALLAGNVNQDHADEDPFETYDVGSADAAMNDIKITDPANYHTALTTTTQP